MTELERFADRFRHCIAGTVEDPAVDVTPGDFSKYLISVVPASFEGMDEGERQEIIWQRVLDGLGPDDRRRVEFIYTDAPSELEADDPRRRSIGAGVSTEPGPNG